jgi:hypothetical protein
VVTEAWRKRYNTISPHSSLGYQPPAPEAYIPHQVANGSSGTKTNFSLAHTPGAGQGSIASTGRDSLAQVENSWLPDAQFVTLRD